MNKLYYHQRTFAEQKRKDPELQWIADPKGPPPARETIRLDITAAIISIRHQLDMIDNARKARAVAPGSQIPYWNKQIQNHRNRLTSWRFRSIIYLYQLTQNEIYLTKL